VKQFGFDNVMEYAANRAGVSLVALAKELGSDDVAGAQIMLVLLDEAIRANTLSPLLRDLLLRALVQALPQGWKQPLGDESQFFLAGAISDWYVELQDHLNQDATIEAGRDLLETELPNGWLPNSPDDPVIVAFVDRCLGRAPS
jgi:hypothetical protein